MIMITMAAYEVGCGSVTWVLLGELFPMHVKDAALALSLAFGFAVNYLAMEIYAIQVRVGWTIEGEVEGFACRHRRRLAGSLADSPAHFAHHHTPRSHPRPSVPTWGCGRRF